MTNDQKQSVKENAVALQSGRDTVVNIGLSNEQVHEIITGLAAQLTSYVNTGKEIANLRLEELEKKIFTRMEEDKSFSSQAFKDPDFQYLITRAQDAYARSGEENIADILVDIIAERSKQKQRSRLSLTLNDAVEKSALLTTNEFSELSLCFIMKCAVGLKIENLQDLAKWFATNIAPFLSSISEEHASYQYLEAHGCASINIGNISAIGLFRETYAKLFSKGFEINKLDEKISQKTIDLLLEKKLIRPCLNDASKFQIFSLSEENFFKESKNFSIPVEEASPIWSIFMQNLCNEEEIIEKLLPIIPKINEFNELWKRTPMPQLYLTSVGIAIGHANLRRVCKLDSDLAIWIK